MQYGMPTLIENSTLNDNILLCKKLGLDFIELNMNFPEYQIDKLEKVEEFIIPAKKYRVYYTIHLDENLNVADFNPLVREAYLETVRRTIEVAKQFVELKDAFGNATQPLTINMHMNHGIYITLPGGKVQMYDRNFGEYKAYFLKFGDLCAEWIGNSDIKLVIENTDGFTEYEKRIIDILTERPVFKMTWDIGHSKAAGEKDMGFLMRHKTQLIHFHIHDGTEDPPRNHLALGDGNINLKSRLDLAGACNARCVLETKTVEALTKSVQWIRNLQPLSDGRN